MNEKKVKKIIYITFIIIFLFASSLFFSSSDFYSYNTTQYLDIASHYIYPDVFNNLYAKKPLSTEKIKQFINNPIINEKLLENFQLTANFLLSGSYFEHYRSSKTKGFETITNLTTPKFLYKPNPVNDLEFQDFMYQRIYRLFFDDTIRERIKRYTQTVGIIEQGSASFIPMVSDISLTNIINETVIQACKKCIENAIERMYGRNYLFMIKGDFLLASVPQVIIKNGNVTIHVKGYIIISGQKYMP